MKTMTNERQTVLFYWLKILLFLIHNFHTISTSKLYTGQRVFTDVNIIDFIDPGKHGFHVVLNEDFVNIHLQPIRLPTVFATAIALKHPELDQNFQNYSSPSTRQPAINAASLNDGLRVTKILYPENVNPEDGLLDGRTIKLLGLRERTWYYVCVEFESNLNRHELATGATCQLKRTLDKFGKSTESVISEIELSEITDRSIAIKLRIDIDFPLRLTISTNRDGSAGIPAQTFILDRSRMLNVIFNFLDPDTLYGSICILEEPLAIPSNTYTAMGRSVNVNMNHCYFDNLKTNPAKLNSQLKSTENAYVTLKAGKRMSNDGVIFKVTSLCYFWVIILIGILLRIL